MIYCDQLPDYVTTDLYKGVVFQVHHWKYFDVEIPVETIFCSMVGDDRTFTFDVDDVKEVARGKFCPGCGQLGCNWE